jgi:hypothetical protein
MYIENWNLPRKRLFLARNEYGQTMILAALLVQMTNPRCQRLHKELDEGVAHRDAMNAHQERPESVLRHRNPAIRGLRGPLERWGRSGCLRDPEGGGTFDCRAGHAVRHAIDDY